jgi:hypothetical protein
MIDGTNAYSQIRLTSFMVKLAQSVAHQTTAVSKEVASDMSARNPALMGAGSD